MKKLFLVLLIFSFAFAATNCSKGFYEKVTVQVIDAKFRPVQGAGVSLYYQLDYTTSKGYIFTKEYPTNSDGMINISIKNEETNQQKVDCNIRVYASYNGKNVSKIIIAEFHPNIIDVNLNLYKITIRITDQNGIPLPGAEIWVGNEKGIGDANGIVKLYAYPGNNRIFVKYGDGKVEENINVIGDVEKDIGLTLYPLKISVVDDNGKALDAVVTVGSEIFNTTNGTLYIKKLASSTPSVSVKYKNLEKTEYVDLSTENNYKLIFDLTPPEIKDVKVTGAGDFAKLVATVIDGGTYSSGIKGIEIGYRAGQEDTWTNLPTYPSGKNQYTAEIPKKNISVSFFVRGIDNDDNQVEQEGQFLFAEEKNSENNTAQIVTEDKPNEIPLFEIVVGFIILAVVIYLIYRFMASKNRE